MQYEDIERKTLDWSLERQIIQKSNLVAQAKKLVEEAEEVLEAILDGDIDHARMELGDTGTVAINLAAMMKTTTTTCIALAYDKIKDRKGMMNSEGSWVKEQDLPKELAAKL